MSTKTRVKLDSKIFNSAELKRELSKLPAAAAKDFAKKIVEEMENSPHTGKIVTKARGESYRVRHQQSRRGERPAKFTGALENSIKSRKTGEFSAQVDSDSRSVNKLIFDDGRILVSNSDLEQARADLQKRSSEIIRSFL